MDILNQGKLRSIIDEINSDENKRRKAEHQKRTDVFNDYQREYVLTMLAKEFSASTVSDMRTCTSINLTNRIITEMASLYKRAPKRSYSLASEEQLAGIDKIYQESKANVKLKKANQKFKLHEQCTIQVLPSEGKIGLKILAPHQYDVVPMPNDPERAMAYIISANDRSMLDSTVSGNSDIQGNYYGSKNQNGTDGKNEKIADDEDYKIDERYVVWTAEWNIVCDGNGTILQQNPNPIKRLPFIDVCAEKDFEFFMRRGSSVVDFALDFSVILSDTVNTNRLQSYAQAVISAEKIPQDLTVGPNRVLFLPIDPLRPEAKPTFEFVNPQPDMKASLELQDRTLSYFLTSKGMDPKTIASTGDAQKYTSGLERLLALIERFEASQDDLDVFECVEYELFELFRLWYTATVSTAALNPEFNFGLWPEEIDLAVNYLGPEMVRTESDKEDSVIKRLDNGLISKVEAIMELRGVDEDKATEILKKIDGTDQQQRIDLQQRAGA